MLEPLIRDTAAAIAAAIADLAESDPQRMVLVLPSDHQISDARAFFEVIRTGADALAERGGIMTIGITPTRPETQYGYIERGEGDGPVYDVTRFREKPDLETAETFLQSGRFFWNGGIFMFRAGEMAAELARQQPEVWTQAKRAVDQAVIDGKCCRLDAEAFAASPKISIDYAVMENAPTIGVVAASFDWNDLGSWNQLHDGSPLDEAGNARFGDVLTIDVKNSYLRSEDRLLAVAGLENIIVVSQPDALLIVHRDKSHLVKDIANEVKQSGEWPPLAVAHSGRPVPSQRVIRKWLFDTALPLWAGAGVDRVHGGVHEALNHDGSPADHGYKRLRVLARQIYCFAYARLLGWEGGPPDLLEHCFDTLVETGWHERAAGSICGTPMARSRTRSATPMTSVSCCWRWPGSGARPNGPRRASGPNARSPIWTTTWSTGPMAGSTNQASGSTTAAPIRTCIISRPCRPGTKSPASGRSSTGPRRRLICSQTSSSIPKAGA
jgi:mannose-1-phosphate guanylyltransferase